MRITSVKHDLIHSILGKKLRKFRFSGKLDWTFGRTEVSKVLTKALVFGDFVDYVSRGIFVFVPAQVDHQASAAACSSFVGW